MPLIALVATCVHHDILRTTAVLMNLQVYAALSEYVTGRLVHAILHANHFEDKYRNHINILADMKRNHPRGYHRLTSKLFSMVYGLVPP